MLKVNSLFHQCSMPYRVSLYLKPESRVHALCFDEADAAGDDVVDGRIIR